MQKILMIVNPKAGKAKSKKYIENIIINLRKNDYAVEIQITTPERNATNIIKEHKTKIEKILVLGGDGTLNETVTGIIAKDIKAEIAFIPLGTTNDFGHSLKVPFNKLDISKNLNSYVVRKIDMGTIDNKPFNYVVSMGLFSKASYKTSRKWKNRVGKLAYYINGFKELFHYKTHKLKLTLDNGKIIDDEFLYGSISNSKYMGGFPVFRKKDIKLDDGKFEVLLAKKPSNILATSIAVIKILTGNLNDKHIIYETTSYLEIESEKGVDLSIDGEYGGKINQAKIEVNKQVIKYLVPNKYYIK